MALDINYSASEMPATRPKDGPVRYGVDSISAMSRYLDRLFSALGERLAERRTPGVADRLAEVEMRLEALEILTDKDTMEDLVRAAREPDSEARPYEEVRRELGLA